MDIKEYERRLEQRTSDLYFQTEVLEVLTGLWDVLGPYHEVYDKSNMSLGRRMRDLFGYDDSE
jgi:hypothetical protein